MKTISSGAMAAIEAGEAIVTGAVEILTGTTTTYTTVGIVDLSSTANGATTAVGGLSVGETISGFDPSDIIRVTLPTGQTWVAWSPWGDPSPNDPGNFTGSQNQFWVIPDGNAAGIFQLGGGVYDGYEAARAAFGVLTFSGASSYTLFFLDNPVGDNSGGLSIKVERGVVSGSETPIRVWGGHGTIEISGNVYQGIGDRGLAQQTAGAVGGVAQGLTLTLSGIEPEALALLEADELKGASVVVRRLIFASDGKTLLDAHIFDRGRVDTVDTVDVIGGAATIKLGVESAARGLGRSGARQRSDSDQRLINPVDGYFRNTAYAGEKMLYWGGKTPARAGSVLLIGNAGSGG